MDKSKVQDIFNSTAVRDVEIEILNTQYEMEKRRYSSEAGEQVIKTLLGTRRTLLNHMFVMDEQSKQLLSDFNEALKAQMIEMRQKAITLFESTIASNVPASFDLKAKCFLGYEYSKIHPVQTIRAKKMWAVMNGTLDDYMPLYWDGAWAFDMEYRNGKMGHIPSENEMLYLNDNYILSIISIAIWISPSLTSYGFVILISRLISRRIMIHIPPILLVTILTGANVIITISRYDHFQ